MKLIEVKDKKTAKQFLDVARIIYKHDKAWVCPLDQDIENIFNPKLNAYYDDGDAIRWILKDDRGKLIGRVAAFFNKTKAAKFKQPTGGLGFFECIDDREAANMLFGKCEEWLSERGMQAMDGPINFGENTDFWGLLVEGFTQPAYGMNYHRPYYKKLFENYGFKPFFEQDTRHLDITVPFPDRFWKIAEWVMRKPNLKFEHFRMAESERFIHDLKTVHDQAWVFHEHYAPLDINVVRRTLEAAKPILVEEFIWFVYHEGEPVAFIVMFPDVNQILKHFNGKLNWINKLRFVYLNWRKTITRTRITILGVVPRFQGQGIESAIFWHMQEPVLVKRPHLNEIEISWVGDFNLKMKALFDAIGAKPGKKHITYRKLFSESDSAQYTRTIPLSTGKKHGA